MKSTSRIIGLIAILLAAIGLLAAGAGGAQASVNQASVSRASVAQASHVLTQQHVAPQAECPPNCPKVKWVIVKVGPGYDTTGPWHDCAAVAPTPGFKKSYTCSFTGGVSNTYSETVGISAEGISASVGFSVTYSTSVTGGTTYTPNSEKAKGEVEWASQYITHKLSEVAYLDGFEVGTHTGYASKWNQPLSRYVPAGTSTSSTSGTFTKKHWTCKKACP